MQVFTRCNAYVPNPAKPLYLTFGTFDGVHLGHQSVFSKVLDMAKKGLGTPAVLTFLEHPLHILKHKEPPYLITSSLHRLRLLDALGFETVFLIRFSKKFSRQSPEQFVKKILCNQLRCAGIVLGYDSHFGKNREGTPELMACLAKKFHFEFQKVKPRLLRQAPISSTHIRNWIQQGQFTNVEKSLGRAYSIMADVVKGRGIGRKLGFPTANLNPHSEALPPQGVYMVRLEVIDIGFQKTRKAGHYFLRDKISKKNLFGLLNIGMRPTVEKVMKKKTHQITAELHVLNFSGNLYGKVLEVTFMRKIRDEKKFDSFDILKKQIQKDVQYADKYSRVFV
ncbi:MAG: bifunctional riboflavin kinase/FMN adenylyltransferase [Candidatus Omnitrophica bacterium]|nr:bifunctional riboflavin kinase/FMN adenylyltransferase [Candidatus Omnitrophota bacterium]